MAQGGADAAGDPVRVALVGANGHGRWHRRVIARLHTAGRVRLVGLCDVRPVEADPDAPVPDSAGLFTDHRKLLRGARPDVLVIATPPHTHAEIATDALRAGADVLLEKPPVLSLAEHRALLDVLAGTGRACQVGFQALGSAALARLVAAVSAGRLGTLAGIGVAGSWQRADGYYQRAPWAGRRTLDGRPVLDGALANPFAHALMQCLAISAAAPAAPASAAPAPAAAPAGPVPGAAAGVGRIELERYRARPIEVDDTACLRVTPDSGVPVVVAVTLCGEGFIAGEITVDGTAGQAVLEYPTDRLRLPGEPELQVVPGRTGLLENLLAHRADRRVPLLAPLALTEPFTAVMEAIQAAPPPAAIDPAWLVVTGTGADRQVTVTGVNQAVRAAAAQRALFSELAVPWATAAGEVD